jgi:hypothetical protein
VLDLFGANKETTSTMMRGLVRPSARCDPSSASHPMSVDVVHLETPLVVYDNWDQPDSRALTSKDALTLVHRGTSRRTRQHEAPADLAIYQGFLVAGAGFEPATFGL